MAAGGAFVGDFKVSLPVGAEALDLNGINYCQRTDT